MNFSGKNVLITGAARGLGAALCHQFASLGSNLMMLDVREELLAQTRESLSNLGIKAIAMHCDVTNQSDINKAIEKIKQEYGILDVVVNNAGILKSTGFGDGSYQDFESIMNVNVHGYARILFSTLPLLGRVVQSGKKTIKEGMVIIISSMAGLVMSPNLQFYGISKATTQSMARALRQHFATAGLKNMHVLNVNPPQFDTELYVESELDGWIKKLRNKKKLPSPDNFATMIVKAASKERKNINLTLLGKLGAFGAKFFPGLIDKSARSYYLKEQRP